MSYDGHVLINKGYSEFTHLYDPQRRRTWFLSHFNFTHTTNIRIKYIPGTHKHPTCNWF